MAKVPNCGECCQQFPVKIGVVRLCVSQFARKESKRLPMVSRFLLHDPSHMGIRGVSGKRTLSSSGRVLDGHRHCQEAFCTLECLPCRSGPLQRFGNSLQEISQRAQYLCAIWHKTAVKIYHAEKTLQLFDVLGGGQSSISAA
jgi:hypothetical protein